MKPKKLLAFALVLAFALLIVPTFSGCFGHDLSGTYYYDGRFPITTFTFSKDGTFTARCDYHEYSTGTVYQGNYSKFGGVYSLNFKGAKTSGGNAVSSFMDTQFGKQYKMSASKVGDNALKVWVSGGTAYAWYGTEVIFYKY